jgi:hypothetical protein
MKNMRFEKTGLYGVLPFAISLLATLLAACQGPGGQNGGVFSSSGGAGGRGPVQLLNPAESAAGEGSAGGVSARREVNEKELARAIELYRLNKKQKPSPYRSAGADLNGDGQPEALVLLEGEDWCAKTGCTLAIFIGRSVGFRPMATIRRVRGPVIIANERHNGWSDLVVGTGLAKYDNRVRLRFGANGYPGNAVMLSPIPRDIEVKGEVLIERAEILAMDNMAKTMARPKAN